MQMTPTDHTLLALLRAALTGERPTFPLSDVDWPSLIDLAFDQGVDAVSVDGYHKWLELNEEGTETCILETDESLEDLKFEWFGSVLQAEEDYRKHTQEISSLAQVYASGSLKMMLLKGYGLSLCYPQPTHRMMGDIDVYLYGHGGEGDNLIKEKFNISSKQNEDKHSTFSWNDITVENHACLMNSSRFPCLERMETFFEEDAKNAVPVSIGDTEIYLPSVMTNALFIPFHCASHFVRGEASLRQVCDWACFVNKYGREVDWCLARNIAEDAGFLPFFKCLNTIVHRYFGVSSECLPQWDSDDSLTDKVLEEVLHPINYGQLKLIGKVKRYFSNAWKYKMVYKDNMLLTAIRIAKAYMLVKYGKKSIWEK